MSPPDATTWHDLCSAIVRWIPDRHHHPLPRITEQVPVHLRGQIGEDGTGCGNVPLLDVSDPPRALLDGGEKKAGISPCPWLLSG